MSAEIIEILAKLAIIEREPVRKLVAHQGFPAGL